MPPWFLPEIWNILAKNLQTPAKVPIKFELTKSAAENNMKVLKQHKNSVSNLIEQNQGSIISYGSEFRPVAHLEFLLMHHKNWLPLVTMLTRGSLWPLNPIADTERLQKTETLSIEVTKCQQSNT